MTALSLPVSSRIAAAAAAACSTSAAFCWVAWSIAEIAWWTWSSPAVCSALASAISPMMSVTRLTLSTTASMVLRALSASCVPSTTLSTESSISSLISLAAAALRWARLRTSDATTAKPRPCSPARAASTAAFSARILVWKAMPSITPMISAIFFDESLIEAIVPTTWATSVPPLMATSDADTASLLACTACSAFCLTVAVSCSIDEAVSSSEAACCSVRLDKSRLPAAISLAPPLKVAAAAHLADHRQQAVVHVLHSAQQLPGFTVAESQHARAQVAAGDAPRHPHRFAQRLGDRACHRQRQQRTARYRQHQQADGEQAGAGVGGVGVARGLLAAVHVVGDQLVDLGVHGVGQLLAGAFEHSLRLVLLAVARQGQQGGLLLGEVGGQPRQLGGHGLRRRVRQRGRQLCHVGAVGRHGVGQFFVQIVDTLLVGAQDMLGLPSAQFLQIVLERLRGDDVGQPLARQRGRGAVDVGHAAQRADAQQHGQAEHKREGAQQFAGGGQVLQEFHDGSLDDRWAGELPCYVKETSGATLARGQARRGLRRLAGNQQTPQKASIVSFCLLPYGNNVSECANAAEY